LPSALFGTATVYVLYQVGKQAWNWKVGLSSAAILALSGFHIWYSQEFRNYALLSLTSTIYMYSVFRIKGRATWSAYLFSSVSAFLMLFSHVFGIFLFVGINLFLGLAWLGRAKWLHVDFAKWMASQVFAAGFFWYWAVQLFAGRAQSTVQWIPELGWYQLFSQLAYLFNGPWAAVVMCSLALYAFHDRLIKPVLESEGFSICSSESWQDALVFIWLAFPILTAIVISLTGRPLFISRYMILCLPAMCLFVTRGLFALNSRKKVQMLAITLMVGGLVYSTWHVHHRERDQYRTVVRDVQSRYEPGDLLAVVTGKAIPIVDYYWKNPGIEVKGFDKTLDVRAWLPARDRIWMIIWRPKGESAVFTNGQQIGSHKVVYSTSDKSVEAYLLSARRPGNHQAVQ
jgi:uncharacterized membrane protein